MNADQFLTVKQLADEPGYPSEGALRWLIHRSAHNGLDVAIRRVGRRVLINKRAFLAWVDGQTDAGR